MQILLYSLCSGLSLFFIFCFFYISSRFFIDNYINGNIFSRKNINDSFWIDVLFSLIFNLLFVISISLSILSTYYFVYYVKLLFEGVFK